MSATPEEIKQAKLNELAVRKFFDIEPDAQNVLYKIAKFALAKPDKYKIMKGMLDAEIKQIIKK